MDSAPRNLTPVAHRISAAQREATNGHRGGVLWLTGLSGAGKSTLAFALEERLFREGRQAYVLDGDNLRHGLSKDLGFSHEDRTENVRRVGEVAALFADAGVICICAFISPYRTDRRAAAAAAPGRFHEVYVYTDIATCERRDPKGLYKKARAGELPHFTAVSDVYEPPQRPALIVDTTEDSVGRSLATLADYVAANFGLSGAGQAQIG